MGIKRIITDKIQGAVERLNDATKVAQLELTVRRLRRENSHLKEAVSGISLRLGKIEKAVKDCRSWIDEGISD
jgi:hypothetical protein